MTNRVRPCGGCGAKFDVSRMSGSVFDCPKCGAAIELEAAPKLPSAMRDRATARSPAKPARARAGRSRAPLEPRTDTPKKRAPVGLYAGAAVAIAVGIGAVALFTGDEPPNAPAPTPIDEPESSARTDPMQTVALANAWDAYLTMSKLHRTAELATRVERAGTDLPVLEALAQSLRDPRLEHDGPAAEALERVGQTALEMDATLAWAHEAIGERDVSILLRACFDECELAFNHADARENRIEALLDGVTGAIWLPAARAAALEADVASIRAREQELAANPRLLDVERARDWVRHNPLFERIRDRIESRYVEPYVLFQEYELFLDADGNPDPLRAKDNARRRKHADALVRREGILLTEMHRRFREMFAERHELPQLADHGRLLKAFFLWDRDTFDQWHTRQGSQMPGFVRAYYSPTEKRIVSYVGGDALRSQDERWADGGFLQKDFDQVTIHEGLHQVFDEYAAIKQGRPLSDDDSTVTPRKSMWLSEGLAELMGAVEYERAKSETLEGVTWRHARMHLGRVQLAQQHLRGGGANWTLSDLVRIDDNGDLLARSGELHPADPPRMANLFYARSWGFVHFLWFYDDGKYRERFQDYVGAEFLDEHGPTALARALGIPDTNDWGVIETEFEWYWEKCLGLAVGRKTNRDGEIVGWWEPDTSAPSGKYDPNAREKEYDDEDEEEDEEGK